MGEQIVWVSFCLFVCLFGFSNILKDNFLIYFFRSDRCIICFDYEKLEIERRGNLVSGLIKSDMIIEEKRLYFIFYNF